MPLNICRGMVGRKNEWGEYRGTHTPSRFSLEPSSGKMSPFSTAGKYDYLKCDFKHLLSTYRGLIYKTCLCYTLCLSCSRAHSQAEAGDEEWELLGSVLRLQVRDKADLVQVILSSLSLSLPLGSKGIPSFTCLTGSSEVSRPFGICGWTALEMQNLLVILERSFRSGHRCCLQRFMCQGLFLGDWYPYLLSHFPLFNASLQRSNRSVL